MKADDKEHQLSEVYDRENGKTKQPCCVATMASSRWSRDAAGALVHGDRQEIEIPAAAAAAASERASFCVDECDWLGLPVAETGDTSRSSSSFVASHLIVNTRRSVDLMTRLLTLHRAVCKSLCCSVAPQNTRDVKQHDLSWLQVIALYR